MYKSIFLTAVRSIRKHGFFAILNISGLAIGMAVFLLIAQYVRFERSYEAFVPEADRIYRVALHSYVNNELVMQSAENYPGVGPALQREFPEVVSYARLYNLGYKNNLIITNEEALPEPIAYKHRRFLYADSAFLPMMGYELLAGDARTALAEANTAVISDVFAKFYFGSDDAVGKTLRMQDDDFNNEQVKVTGVFKALPENTHLKFDVLFSYKTLYGRGDWAISRYDQSWQRKDMYTFIKVAPGTDAASLQGKFAALFDQYNPALKERNQRDELMLQPLRSIHLTSQLAEEPEPNGDERIVSFMAMIGLFVLVIAWINYINLATAKAMERANEVGVRKVMGAVKQQLINQFLAEAFVVNLISMVLAVVIVLLVLPYFNTLSGLQLSRMDFMSVDFVLLAVLLWLGGALLSGFYPAFVLSSFKPVQVLKGKLRNSKRGLLLRKVLVVSQFAASVILIAGTLIVYEQLQFMMKRDIGMNIDQVLVVERPGIAPRDRQAFNSSVDVFRNELANQTNVLGVSTSVTIPGKQREYKAMIRQYAATDETLVPIRFNSMDYNFMDVFGMKLLAGRAFSPEYPNDPDTSVIITESASRLLGFETPDDALGETVSIPAFRFDAIVVGVVNDYHQVSLKKALEPTIFYCTAYSGEFYSVRIAAGTDVRGTVALIESAWRKAFPGNPFDYFFLDDYFNQQYENEQKFGKLFTTFAGVAIMVGCLGLLGLSAYSANQRTKEIGIRKVLGSSVPQIFMLLSVDYIRLVALSIVLAVPLVYYMMQQWLSGFSYRVDIGVMVFLIAGVTVLIIALAVISFQTLKAARTNPVQSLRYE